MNNTSVCNAKFKVGDKVLYKGRHGVEKFTVHSIDTDGGQNTYYLSGWGYETVADESELKAANSTAYNSTNPIVAKAMNAVSREWEATFRAEGSNGGMPTVVTVSASTYYDAIAKAEKKIAKESKSTGRDYYLVTCKPVSNSRACNSSDPVVRKGMNAVATNDKDGANFVLRMMSGVYATIANLRGSSGDQKLDSMLDQLYKLATEIKAEAMKQSH